MTSDRDLSIEDFGPKAAATALLVATAAAALHVEPSFASWGDGFARATSLGLCVGVGATMFAVFRGGSFERRCVAAALLLAVAGFLVARLGGWQTRVSVWPDLRYVSALLVAVSAAGIGVIVRRRWARWLALCLAFAGASTAVINLASFGFAPGWLTWLLGVFAIGGALVIVNLAGAKMAASDALDDRDFSQAWPDRVRPAWWLRAAVLSGLVAAPMLVLYAWVQQGTVEGFETPAVAIAVGLVISTVLVVRGHALGALLLGLSGLALVVFVLLLVGAAEFAWEREVALYYVLFWLPAGVAATISGAGLGRAALRLTG
jgi:hypothetical protein